MRNEIGPDSLIEICLREAARSIKRYNSLDSLSEELTTILFHMVLERGALTPRILSVSYTLTVDQKLLTPLFLSLQLFQHTDHESLIDKIKRMGIKDTPPLDLAQGDRWLHEKHKFF